MMKRATRSCFLALRASARFGRAVKLRQSGKTADALPVGLEALAFLGHPHVIRFNRSEVAVLCAATLLVEGFAKDLDLPGAAARDIADALDAIRSMGPNTEFAEWEPYLAYRAAHVSRNNAA
jgi:hypothetical protein